MHFRLADDFNERYTAAIEVFQRESSFPDGGTAMDRFTGFFFQLNLGDVDLFFVAIIGNDIDLASSRHRLAQLGNLITLRQVRIKVIFAFKDYVFSNLTIKSQPRTYRKFEGLFIQDRQRAGHAETSWTYQRIRLSPELRRAGAKQLGSGRKFGVYFQTNYRFPGRHLRSPLPSSCVYKSPCGCRCV